MLPPARFSTCSKADLHGSLSMPKNLKLRQRNLIRNAYWVRTFVPFITNIPHGVTDCNHKPVLAADRQRTAAYLKPNRVQKKKRRNVREDISLLRLPVVRLITVALCLCPSTRNCGSSTSLLMPTLFNPEFHL